MFAHISHKVHWVTRFKNAQHLLVWVYHKDCVHIMYSFWAYYTQYLMKCVDFAGKIKTSLLLQLHQAQSQNIAHVCYGLDWVWHSMKKTKAGISTWTFPLESLHKKIEWYSPQTLVWTKNRCFTRIQQSAVLTE